jgi:putative DNA primase/helicase
MTEEFVTAALNEDELEAEIKKLAALPVGVYETSRRAAAERLGLRASVLDKLVASGRPKCGDGEAGAAIKLIAPKAAETEVNGSTLLTGIIQQFDAYVFMPNNEKLAAALWVIASYAFDAFSIFPRLCLKSATKGCGKSTLLDILECLEPISKLRMAVDHL